MMQNAHNDKSNRSGTDAKHRLKMTPNTPAPLQNLSRSRRHACAQIRVSL